MVPLIPILCVLLMGGGAGGLIWYNSLPDKKKKEADQIALNIARDVFEKGVDELTHSEAEWVHDYVQRQLTG